MCSMSFCLGNFDAGFHVGASYLTECTSRTRVLVT